MAANDRCWAIAMALVAAGCAPAPGGNVSAPTGIDRDGIACARGDAPLARTCTVERADSKRGLLLTLRRDDGSFRRLLVTRDGRGVIAADGAEPARVTLAAADRIEVRIGDDRYLLPATVEAGR